mgnify:CR=1 FL=1
MWNIFRKIISTGTVTERWDKDVPPGSFRGELVLDQSRCHSCGLCVTACPVAAITMNGKVPDVDHRPCLFCGRCVLACPAQALSHTINDRLAAWTVPEKGQRLEEKIKRKLGRSLAIRHVDAGSCNACDWEMTHLTNPVYDIQQYGIDFVASPRHADLLMVTGTVTRNLLQALVMTYDATPAPRLVMAVGSCAAAGRTYGSSYAIVGSVDTILPVDVYVPGCPPRPQALLHGLMLIVDKI